MALHSFENGDDVARRDWGSFLVINPPIMEGAAGSYVETLLRRRSFAECVGDVRTEDDEVLGSGGGIENPGACVINTVGIGMVEDANFAMASGGITSICAFLRLSRIFWTYVQTRSKTCLVESSLTGGPNMA